MLSVFVPAESSLKKIAATDPAALPDNAVWIDLVKPTAGEDQAVERLAGIAVPTREDMQEIEISSRLYIENGARYMTATLMCAVRHRDAADHGGDLHPRRSPAGDRALRRAEAVRAGREQAGARRARRGSSGEMVLMELLDAVIDRCADILERAGADVDQVSATTSSSPKAARTARPSDIPRS